MIRRLKPLFCAIALLCVAGCSVGNRDLIKPGDLVAIHIRAGADPADQVLVQQHVARDGTVTLLNLGDVKIAGGVPEQAQAKIQNCITEVLPELHTTLNVVARAQPGPFPGTIHLGDQVVVDIWGLPGPGEVLHLDSYIGLDGTLQVPGFGPIQLSGETEQEAIQKIQSISVKEQVATGLPMNVLRLPSNPPPTDRQPSNLLPPPLIQVGDYVKIEIWEVVGSGSQTTLRTQVGQNGTVECPLIPPVKIAGSTESKAAQDIANAYGKHQILDHAPVVVQRFRFGLKQFFYFNWKLPATQE